MKMKKNDYKLTMNKIKKMLRNNPTQKDINTTHPESYTSELGYKLDSYENSITSSNSMNTTINKFDKFDFESETESENGRLIKLREYYRQQYDNTENSNQHNIENIKLKEKDTSCHSHSHNNSNGQNQTNNKNNDEIICKICFNNQNTQNHRNLDNFIILSCNHTFHIKCLAEIQFNDMFKFHVIDNDYFKTRKCMVCTKTLEIEELLFLHSKFLSNTKNLIHDHESKIKNLEMKLKNLKDDLKNCYEYKNKLQYEREKSKEIVSNLTMMI